MLVIILIFFSVIFVYDFVCFVCLFVCLFFQLIYLGVGKYGNKLPILQIARKQHIFGEGEIIVCFWELVLAGKN